MKLSGTSVGVMLTAISAIGFSTLNVFAVAAYKAGANVTTLLGVRFTIAAALLWVWTLLTRQRLPDWKTGLLLMLMGGAGYSAMSVMYMSAVQADRLSPALAALLLYTYPALVTLMAWWFEGQRLAGRQAAAVGLTLLGVCMVVLAPGAGLAFTPLGAALALGSAISYSIYIFFGSRVTRRTSPLVATAYICTSAAAVFLIYGTAARQLIPLSAGAWLAGLGTAIFATVLAVLLFFAGMERLGPSQASVISTLEPVGTAVLAAAFLGDRMGVVQIAGGLMVLAGVIMLQLRLQS